MEISVLGTMEVRRDGEPVPLAGAQLRRFLAILVVHTGKTVANDQIADALWADEQPASPTGALHVLVSRVRQLFDPDRTPRADAGPLVTVAPGYQLRLGRDQIDALRFEDEVAAAREAVAAERWLDATALLDTALRRWRGPALVEFADEFFAHGQVTRWNELRAEAEEDRIDALLALGQSSSLVAELEALVAAAPYRERRTAQLMRALYRAGRQSDALRVYEALRHRLADELGLAPGPDVQRLEHAILLQDEALATERPPDPYATPVGRDVELAVLHRCLERATGGEVQTVLVSGEAGIGKTTTLYALAADGRAAGAQVWWGTCAEGIGAGPYRPWTEALAAGGIPWPATEPADAGAGPAGARRALFDHVIDAIRAAAARRPLVILLDDLHWADVPSLRLLESAAVELWGAPVLVAVAFRPTEAIETAALAATLDRLRTEVHAIDVPIGRLPPQAVATIVESMTGDRSPAVAALVHAKTGGNPLFVRELVRLLTAAGALDEDLSGEVGAPPTVRELVDRAFGHLSADGREVVAAAAVAGAQLGVGPLAAIADCEPGRFDAALGDALAAGILVDQAGPERRVGFSHDLVREHVYDELSAIRRARLHRRTGEVLEALAASGRDVPPSDLAHHFVAATRAGGDASKAARYATAAAEVATRALAYEEAVIQYERAVDAGAAVDAATRTELLLALGDARWRAGEAVAARETFLEAVHAAREAERPTLFVRAVLGFGGGFFRTWHATRGAFGDRPARLMEEALTLVDDADSPERARLLGLLAEERYYTDDPRRLTSSLQAVEMARRLGDAETLAAALSSRLLAAWDPDHVEERRASAAEIIAIAESSGQPELVLFGLCCRFVAELELCDTTAADATLAAIEAAADDLRQPLYLWQARWLRALEALFRGRFAEVEPTAEAAFEIGQRTEDPDAFAIYAVQLGVLRLEQARTAEVVEGLRLLAQEFAESPSWRAGLCLALAEEGELDAAAAELEHLSPDRFAALPRDFAWLAALAMLSQAVAFIGDREQGRVLYELLLPYEHHNVMTGDRNCWGSATHYLGLLALVDERWDDAAAWFERAVDVNEGMGAVPWVAHSRYGLALSLSARSAPGDQDRASAAAAAAAQTAAALGMDRLLRHMRSVARPRSGIAGA